VTTSADPNRDIDVDVDDNRARTSSTRNAIVALLLLAPAPTLGVIAALLMKDSSLGVALWMFAKVWLLAFPLAWHFLVDKASASLSPMRHGGLGVGIGTGVLISAIIIGAYWLIGRHWIDPQLVRDTLEPRGLNSKAAFLVAAAYWVFVNALLEEYVYRWFIYRKCEALMPGWAAVVAAAVIFTTHHTVILAAQFDWRVTLLGTIGVFVGGALWSWMYLRYRSVWPGYVSHAIVDIGIMIVAWRLLFAG